MVISYSIKELNAIGEMVILKEIISRVQAPPDDQQLTSSVAEFFRKAQQNFYSQTSIDPTKVRRLSEVEAELVGGRQNHV